MESHETIGHSLPEIASTLRARAAWIVGAAIGGMVVAAIVSAAMPPVYRADLAVMTTPKDMGAPRPDLGRLLGTWLYLLGDGSTLADAKTRLAGRYDAGELDTIRIAARPVDNSMIVVLTVRAGAPQLALDFAQAMLDAAAAREMAGKFPVDRVAPAQLSGDPESPKLRRNLVLGGCAGLLVGTALAFLVVDLRRYRWNPPRPRSEVG